MTADSFARASRMAEEIIKGEGISSLPIDPKAFASAKGFTVEAMPASSLGVSGMLIRYGNEFAIAYSTSLGNEGFENFSVAHELGHFYLPGHVDAVIGGDNGTHESRAGFNSNNHHEMEADRFSASFLMPRHLFIPAAKPLGSGLTAIEKMSALCKTSLHATAIRFVQCSMEPMAIVISVGHRIDHCFMSDSLKNAPGIDWLRKREAVPPGTPTQNFNRNPKNVSGALRLEQTSNLQQWFGGKRSIEISEDVVGLGGYGKTLTVLYSIDLPEPEEEEEEAQLIESWTPRFRK
jgi:hypothetical protein